MGITASPVRTPRISGLRVARETLRNGLRVDGPLVRGLEGSDIARFTFAGRTAFVLKHPDYVDHVLHAAVDRYHKSREYEMLRSVVGQGVPGTEILIVDDCSTDDSREVAESLVGEFSGVRLLQQAVDGGPAAARNLGLRKAAGR